MPGGRRHYWIAAILLLVLAGGLLLLLTNIGGKSSLTRRLPDGTVVAIRKVSYGKVHTFVMGNFLQRFAGQILPDKLAQKFGIQTLAITNKTASICIFVEITGTNLTLPRASAGWSVVGRSGSNSVPMILSGPAGALQPRAVWLISGSASSQFNLLSIPNLAGVVSANGAGDDLALSFRRIIFASSNRVVQAFQLPLDSHAAAQLRLRLDYAEPGQDTRQVMEFTAPNPAARVPAHWTAPVLPQTNRLDDLKMVLLDLHTCSNQLQTAEALSSYLVGLGSGTNLWTSARFQFLQNGVPTRDFTVIGVRVEDEEGNAYAPRGFLYANDDFPDVIRFDGGFSPKETRKFLFRIERAAPPYNSLAPARYVEFLARPSPLGTNATPAK